MTELGGEMRRARDRGKQETKQAGHSDEQETEGRRLRGAGD